MADEEAVTELMWYALSGEEDQVANIVSQDNGLLNAFAKGAFSNNQSHRQWTVLMAASFWGKKSVVEVLVAMGADVNLVDREGETALMLAVRGDEEEVAALLLQHGAHVADPDPNGHNVIINAAANNQVSMLRLFLHHGAKQHVDAQDSEGCTALWWAAKNGSLTAMKMLLTDYGANPWLANHKGKTPQQVVGPTRRHCKDVFKHIERPFELFKARTISDNARRHAHFPSQPLPPPCHLTTPPPRLLIDGQEDGVDEREGLGEQGMRRARGKEGEEGKGSGGWRKRRRAGGARGKAGKRPRGGEEEDEEEGDRERERRSMAIFSVRCLSSDLFRELLDGLRLMV